MMAFDEAVALDPIGDGRWRGHADRRHESISGMFGGWAAAVALKSVLCSAEVEGSTATPAALTVNFVDRVTPGEDVVLAVARLGGGGGPSNTGRPTSCRPTVTGCWCTQWRRWPTGGSRMDTSSR